MHFGVRLALNLGTRALNQTRKFPLLCTPPSRPPPGPQGLAGLYFGWLYTASGHCIFVPAVAHALYDFCALVAAHLEVAYIGFILRVACLRLAGASLGAVFRYD